MSIQDLSAVRGHVETLKWAKAKAKELKELENRAKAEIQSAMGLADTGTLDNEIVITWKHQKKNLLNQKALKEAHPEIIAEFTELTPSRTFLVVDQ